MARAVRVLLRRHRSQLVRWAVAAVALGLVGMHQLSSGHTLVTADDPAPAHPHTSAAGGHLASAMSATPHEQLPVPPDGWHPTGSIGWDAECVGCAHRGLMACWLSLTLLAVTALRRRRAWPTPAATARPFGRLVLPPAPGWRRALSWVELSVSRT